MLSDYLIIVPSLVALTTSVLGVVASHFKPEQTRWKYALLASSIALSLVAAGATIAGQRHVLAVQAGKEARSAAIHKELGEFIQRGDAVIQTLADAKNQTAVEEAGAWAGAVEGYLKDTFGQSYVARFRDGAGMMSLFPPSTFPQDRVAV